MAEIRKFYLFKQRGSQSYLVKSVCFLTNRSHKNALFSNVSKNIHISSFPYRSLCES